MVRPKRFVRRQLVGCETIVQLAEFAAVLITNVRASAKGWEPIVAIYIMTYLLFGVLAFAVRWKTPQSLTLHTPENAETLYSIIGALAKVSIYLAEFMFLYGVEDGALVLSIVVGLIIVALGAWVRQRFRL